jgi:hypothetical protein
VLRVLPALIELALIIYCLIDCIQTPADEVRNLPKVVWILLILLIPIIGPIVWLAAGRPQRGPRRQVPWPSTQTAGFPEYERPRPTGPDDDPEFLHEMKRGNEEQERLLLRWEDDLRRREQQLREPTASTGETMPDQVTGEAPDGSPGRRADDEP